MNIDVDTKQVMSRFPTFELSYETVGHKKVSSTYDICFAIAQGRKYFAWFTFYEEHDICLLLDVTREKKIGNVSQLKTTFNRGLSLGTLVYGTLIEDPETTRSVFLIEDMVYFKGIPLSKVPFGDKLGFIYEMLSENMTATGKGDTIFALPVAWKMSADEDIIPSASIPYTIHHVQYRSLRDIVPFVNRVATNLAIVEKPISIMPICDVRFDYTSPQYKFPTIFKVTANVQLDVYHLYAFGKNSALVYVGVAYIPNYKTSVYMNGLFRNIKENQNLDAIEESDDEEDFQNCREDKYVDLGKTLCIECVFHPKFRKWVPVKTVDPRNSRIVHVRAL